jgi:type II secretory pathway component PulM
MTLARIQAASIKRAVPDAEAATSDAAQATTDPASTLQHGIAIV